MANKILDEVGLSHLWGKINNKFATITSVEGLTASDVGADAEGSAAQVLTDAKAYNDAAYANANAYTDQKIADLINGAPTTLDTLKEISDAMAENEEVVDALDKAIGTKANQSELDTHTGNDVIHVTADERAAWNNKLPNTGGNISGNVNLTSPDADTRGITFINSLRNVSVDLDYTGKMELFDNTANKAILESYANGVNKFYGTADEAIKSTFDGEGNNIAETYLKTSGGKLTGQVDFEANNANASIIPYEKNIIIRNVTDASNYTDLNVADGVATLTKYTNNSVIASGNILHSGNYDEYALSRDGGNVDGKITLLSDSAIDRDFILKNSKREILSRVSDGGGYILHDITNSKRIIESSADGINTFNGTALNVQTENSDEINFRGLNGKEVLWLNIRNGDTGDTDAVPLKEYRFADKIVNGNSFIALDMESGRGTGRTILHTGNVGSYALPITGGTVNGAINQNGYHVINTTGQVPLVINSGEETSEHVMLGLQKHGNYLGYLSMYASDKNNPCFYIPDGVGVVKIFHEGNKPTGSYTGNSDATERVITTGGLFSSNGGACLIYNDNGVGIVTHRGAVSISYSGVKCLPVEEAMYDNGNLVLKNADTVLNNSGSTTTYIVL